MSELMLRMIVCDKCGEDVLVVSLDSVTLETYDLMREIRDSRARMALRRVLRFAITSLVREMKA